MVFWFKRKSTANDVEIKDAKYEHATYTPSRVFGVYSLFKMACMRECDMKRYLQIINPNG